MGRISEWIDRLWQHAVQDVPPELDACESCREVDCTAERAATCETRRVPIGEKSTGGEAVEADRPPPSPCPWCKGRQIMLQHILTERWAALCFGCWARGPEAKTSELAEAKWNEQYLSAIGPGGGLLVGEKLRRKAKR